MNLETIPTHGRRAVDFLAQYEERPESIVPNWAVDKKMTVDGQEVSREIFFNFVNKIASQIRKRISDSICLDNNGIQRLRINIYNLSESFAKDAAIGRLRDVDGKDVAHVIREIASGNRLRCEDCLTRPSECQWRRGDAPYEKVIESARHFRVTF